LLKELTLLFAFSPGDRKQDWCVLLKSFKKKLWEIKQLIFLIKKIKA
jgi:hypothetical protein